MKIIFKWGGMKTRGEGVKKKKKKNNMKARSRAFIIKALFIT